ncbi:MAG: VWA domain-containing protein [Pontiellaceae bacterium]|nr:VWA domain-containing protein [Pontiellaceae bacterium]
MKALSKRIVLAGFCLVGALGASAAEEDSGIICRVEMDNSVVYAGSSQKAVVKVTLDAPKAPKKEKRPPVNLTIVLDRSGSMSGSKIEKACDAAITALRRLGPEDMFSLVTYDHEVNTVVPSQSAANSERIEAQIRSIRSGGNTALFAGVSQGASETRKHLDGRYVNRILLLSDGLANVGPSSPAELGRLGTALSKEGISVTTIGVGTDYNEDLMTLMAQNSDGNNYFVESSVDLPRIFNAELGDVLSVVASKVTIEVKFPEGVRPLRIIGRDGRVGEDHVELSLNQLYGGQEKYALIEVELPAGSEGEERKVADARCSYQDMIANREASSEGNASVRFTGSKDEVAVGWNIAVNNDLYLNKKAEAQDQAIDYVDNAEYEKAAEVLFNNAEQLKVYALSNSQLQLMDEAEEMEQQAALIQEEQSIGSKDRKVMRNTSYGVRYQQNSF